jgi:hypothetical protein
MLWKPVLFYILSYFVAYLLLKMTQSFISIFFPTIPFHQNTWIRFYCIYVVLIIHFIWIHCHFGKNKISLQACHHIHPNHHLRNILFPLLFLTPIYILFFSHYIQFYQEEKKDPEIVKKVNRILAKIMILMFIFTIVFLFLTQRYRHRTIQWIDMLSIFEIF